MKGLFKSSRHGLGRGAHHHIIYLNDETPSPTGSASPGRINGHNHPVVQDPNTGEWYLGPSEDDGHTHEIEDYTFKESKKKEEDNEIVREIIRLYRAAKEHESDSLEMAKESEEFYTGKGQWTPEQKRVLESQNRAALTINKIQKNIDELSGYQRQQRTDIRYLPVEDGDQRAADLYTLAAKYVLSRCNFAREEAKVFLDQAITGRGNFHIRVDHVSNPSGNIIVERFPCNEVYYGPHEKEDLEDCEVVVKTKWYNESKLAALYPDKKNELQKSYKDIEDYSKVISGGAGDDYRAAMEERGVYASGPDFIDIIKKEFRVIEAQQRTYDKTVRFVNPITEDFHDTDGWESKDIEDAKKIPGIFGIPVYKPRMRITRVAGNVLLDDENPADNAFDDFDLIPVYAHKRGDCFWGKIEAAKDPQKEVNKRHSQAVDIANKMAAYGWFYDNETFPNDTEKEKFKNTSAAPGFMVEVTSSNRLPAKIEGVKFPTELVQLLSLGDQELAEIMNISLDSIGANDSGVAILQKTKLKLTGNEFLFENLSFAKQKLGRMLLKGIQRHYSPERIYRIVSNWRMDQDALIAGRDPNSPPIPVSDYSREEIIDILANNEAAEYDVIVDETTYSPTSRLGIFMILSDLAQAGQPIPFEALLEFMDAVPKAQKDKILSYVQAQQEAQAQEQQQKAQMELGKTLIAKGIDPSALNGQGQFPQPSPAPGEI